MNPGKSGTRPPRIITLSVLEGYGLAQVYTIVFCPVLNLTFATLRTQN